MVTVYWPGVEELNEHVTVVVLFEAKVAFDGQETETAVGVVMVRLMVPESPNRLVNVTFPVLDVPVGKGTDPGPDMLKSVMVTLRTTEWLCVPIVPVMVTV